MSRTIARWTFPVLLTALAAAPAPAQEKVPQKDPPRFRYLEIRGPKGEMNARAIFSHIEQAAFTRDCKVVAAGAGATVFLWDAADGKELLRIQLPEEQIYHHLVFSDDAKTLAWCGHKDPMIRIFDARTGRQIREYRQPNSEARGGEGFSSRFMTFSPDGTRMAFHGKNYYESMDVFDVATGKLVVSIKQQECGGCAFSPDGKTIATQTHNAGVHLWDAASGKLVRELRPNRKDVRGGGVTPIAFSPDGAFLATAGQTRDCFEVWKVESGKQLCTVRGKHYFYAVSFAPDSQSVVCTEADGRPYLYHLTAEKVMHRFNPHDRNGNYVRFTPDGKRVVIIGEVAGEARQSAIYLYDIPPAALNPPGAQIDDTTLEKLWDELPTDNELKLQRVQQAFRTAAKPAVELFKKKIPPLTKEQQKQAEQWIAELDDDAFARRDAAMKELRAVAHQFEPLLRARHEAAAPGEIRNRLTFVLNRIKGEPLPASLVQELRAVALLEQMATSAARNLLTSLAEGAPQARRTVEARAALERMGKGNGSKK